MPTKETKDVLPLRWPVYSGKSLPAQPRSVQLIFMGLAGFWCSDSEKKVMAVGFHCKNDHHSLKIEVFDEHCSPLFTYAVEKAKKIDFAIEVTKPDDSVLGKPGAYCFYGNDGEEFKREYKTDAPEDFRWLVDFEREFYPAGVRPQHKAYRPRLYVPSGLFHTLAVSRTTFDKIREGESSFFGNVAKVMAANIYSKPDGLVKLKWPGQEVTLNQPTGPVYAYFSNDCLESGKPCKWIPNSNDETKRSDFHLNYKAFHLDGKPKYGLKERDPGVSDPDRYGPCKTETKGTDRAPCMGAGFGQTSEFPDP